MMNVKQLKKLADLVICSDRYMGAYHPGQMICALLSSFRQYLCCRRMI
jgi:hypothetical protein